MVILPHRVVSLHTAVWGILLFVKGQTPDSSIFVVGDETEGEVGPEACVRTDLHAHCAGLRGCRRLWLVV